MSTKILFDITVAEQKFDLVLTHETKYAKI